MAISIVAAYSSGETALVALSTAILISARPLGSPNCTTAVPKSAIGCGKVSQSGGALIENRPWGSRHATRPWAGIGCAVAPAPGPTPVFAPDPGAAEVAAATAAVGFATDRPAVGAPSAPIYPPPPEGTPPAHLTPTPHP